MTIYLCNHPHNKDSDYLHHPRSFTHALLQPIPPSAPASGHVDWLLIISDYLALSVMLDIWKDIACTSFMSSFTFNIFEIHPW